MKRLLREQFLLCQERPGEVAAVRSRRPGSACVMHYGRRVDDPEDILRAFETMHGGQERASGSEPRRAATSSKMRVSRSDLSELAVDAVRRRWAAEDLAGRGGVKERAAVKRESVALRKLVKQLRDSRAVANGPTQAAETYTDVAHPTAALPGAPLILPIAALASTGDCCYRSDEGADTLRSKHSDTNSTVSVVDECEVSNCSLWASTEAIAHQKSLCSRDYIRPVSVPIIDLNRIS
eukprot:CAMPEP_0169167784 /NCGR_PEP_ID=MMETSP1015-20121227/60656_1 /TAXON_ID=342587 /ORGANISM="Karlodinium micrum, Strain CCMP2283" /LENGTH=236 /DNA_ID=CAMNT_0009240517 /DNA_START=31 /DNA_END=737 /DNA_ORIENTATION=+